MKRILSFVVLSLVVCSVFGQNAVKARKILDKTAAVVGAKSGATASFSMSGKYGSQSGTIAIKGNKFNARTGNATMWYDGKTQWTYMKSTNEVNVSTPTEAQQQSMNPYKFITIYKTGFAMDMKSVGKGYQIHLVAQNKKRSIQEMYITVSASYQPQQVRMRQQKGWTTINISNFHARKLSDNTFRFNAKDYPKAEVIDLR